MIPLSPSTTQAQAPPSSGVEERSRPLRADARRNREAVLRAARKCFAELGVDAQMEEIAREAGVGVGTVYRHFPDKTALLEALVVERFEQFTEAARRALERDDPWEAFSDWMYHCAELQAQDRAYCYMLTEELPNAERTDAAETVGLADVTAEMVERGKNAGVIREDLRPADVPLILCGLGATVLAGGGPIGGTWRRHLAIALAGMRAPARAELPE